MSPQPANSRKFRGSHSSMGVQVVAAATHFPISNSCGKATWEALRKAAKSTHSTLTVASSAKRGRRASCMASSARFISAPQRGTRDKRESRSSARGLSRGRDGGGTKGRAKGLGFQGGRGTTTKEETRKGETRAGWDIGGKELG